MYIQSLFLAASALLLSRVGAEEGGKGSSAKEEEAEWSDVVNCFKILTNQTTLPMESQLSPVQVTRDLFTAICGTKEQFLTCVDHSLSSADNSSVVHLFRPLFNLTLVTEAYDDLCHNLTVTDSEEDLTCLLNSTALLPCYNEYYNYLFYLSVVKRFGSPQRQLSDQVVNTLLCTLAEERRDCEVAALSACSTKIGHVMQSFYQKTIPSACNDEDTAVEDTTAV